MEEKKFELEFYNLVYKHYIPILLFSCVLLFISFFIYKFITNDIDKESIDKYNSILKMSSKMKNHQNKSMEILKGNNELMKDFSSNLYEEQIEIFEQTKLYNKISNDFFVEIQEEQEQLIKEINMPDNSIDFIGHMYIKKKYIFLIEYVYKIMLYFLTCSNTKKIYFT